MDLNALVAQASAILDAATEPFLAGHRAESAVPKKGDDFATEVDLAIERQVVAALVEATGIGVHGEEFGGPPVDSPWVWVLDPIDGTFNYAAGSPMASILLAPAARRRAGGRADLVAVHRRPVHRRGGWPADEKRRSPAAVGSGQARPRRWSASEPSARIPAAGSRDAIGWRCWKTSAGSRRGCACTAPPASTWRTSPTEYLARQ